jgi:hypothetical protein
MSFGMLLGFSIALVIRSLMASTKKETMLNARQRGRIAPESEGKVEFVETEVSNGLGNLYIVKGKLK